jgi:hypothetical protein
MPPQGVPDDGHRQRQHRAEGGTLRHSNGDEGRERRRKEEHESADPEDGERAGQHGPRAYSLREHSRRE